MVKLRYLCNKMTLHGLHGYEHFLPVQDEGNDDPEHAAPQSLGELGRVGPHVADHEVEGEEVVADTVSTVEEDAVHAGIEERLPLPQFLNVDDDVEEGQEGEGKAGGDQNEGN